MRVNSDASVRSEGYLPKLCRNVEKSTYFNWNFQNFRIKNENEKKKKTKTKKITNEKFTMVNIDLKWVCLGISCKQITSDKRLTVI